MKGNVPFGLCPSKLRPRRSPPRWHVIFYTPLEVLLVVATSVLGLAAVMVATPLDQSNAISDGVTAAAVHGTLVLTHGLCEGPRLQMLPAYVPVLPLALVASGVLGETRGVRMVIGIFMLLLVALSLFLLNNMPRMLPVDSRGPFAVGIATEHIHHTEPAVNGDKHAACAQEKDHWPLELMVQVFYPVERSCLEKLPWFPSEISRFRRSIVPAWGGARRLWFGLTQAGVVGAAVILATSRSSTLNAAQCLGKLSLASFWCLRETPAVWAVLFALALFFTCLVSDLRLGSSRSAFRARYLSRKQARSIAKFAKMPQWIMEPICGLYAPGFDAGHFHAPEVPSFPVAQLAADERKRQMVIFSHGLCGNRSMYSTFVAEIASHGYVVVVLEHNDGSASSCLFPDGRETEYKRPPNLHDMTATENRTFRLAQLNRREREIKLVKAHLEKLVGGLPTDFIASRSVGLHELLDIERPAFIGHSFGGATILHELSREAASSNDGGSARESDYSMAFLMDPWNFPLSDEARGQTVRIPSMIVTTDTFLGPEGEAREDRLAENAAASVRAGVNDLAMQLRVRDAEHSNFSDSVFFAPDIMKRLKSAGKMDGVAFIDQVSRLALCALQVFLRRRTEVGDIRRSPCFPDGLTSVLTGADLPEVFNEAWVRRGCTRGALPSSDVCL